MALFLCATAIVIVLINVIDGNVSNDCTLHTDFELVHLKMSIIGSSTDYAPEETSGSHHSLEWRQVRRSD